MRGLRLLKSCPSQWPPRSILLRCTCEEMLLKQQVVFQQNRQKPVIRCGCKKAVAKFSAADVRCYPSARMPSVTEWTKRVSNDQVKSAADKRTLDHDGFPPNVVRPKPGGQTELRNCPRPLSPGLGPISSSQPFSRPFLGNLQLSFQVRHRSARRCQSNR